MQLFRVVVTQRKNSYGSAELVPKRPISVHLRKGTKNTKTIQTHRRSKQSSYFMLRMSSLAGSSNQFRIHGF
jgi:hypothetical protein